MKDREDTSLEAQFSRNHASDLRDIWGCQLALLFVAAVSLFPLAYLGLISDNLPFLAIVSVCAPLLLAVGASQYHKRVPESSIRRRAATLTIFLAPCAALAFVVLWLSAFSAN